MMKSGKRTAHIGLGATITLLLMASSMLTQPGVPAALGNAPPIYEHDNLAGREAVLVTSQAN